MMNKRLGRRKYIYFLFILIPVLSVTGCTDFFSTSLAPWAARDPASLVPPVTAGNVRELILQAENNPDLSLAILKGIQNSVGSASPEDRRSLEAAALEAAGNATGLAASLLSQAGKISSVMGDPDKAKELVVDAIKGMSHLNETRDLLADILPRNPDSEEFKAFTQNAGAEDLVMAAAIILAAESGESPNSDDFINNFDPNSVSTPSLKLAVSLATAAADKPELLEGDSPLKDILSGLNLLPSNLGKPSPSVAVAPPKGSVPNP
ncbi:MAG: hypothetical protein LBQ38_01055 [Spirochaetaceae bacterium]|jgi:hypothetical protein|nr:hypothetical protein [Spirochaetaceae bacterium]